MTMDMEYDLEKIQTYKEPEDPNRNKNNDDRRLERSADLADIVYVFCPELDRGILFYDQSPKGAVAKFAGSLPAGQFFSSGFREAEWDNSINGERRQDVFPNQLISFVTNVDLYPTINGYSNSITTVMVSLDTFKKVVKQLRENKVEPNGYTLVDFGTLIYDYDEFNRILHNDSSNIKSRHNV